VRTAPRNETQITGPVAINFTALAAGDRAERLRPDHAGVAVDMKEDSAQERSDDALSGEHFASGLQCRHSRWVSALRE
jgi:hypothetical protein